VIRAIQTTITIGASFGLESFTLQSGNPHRGVSPFGSFHWARTTPVVLCARCKEASIEPSAGLCAARGPVNGSKPGLTRPDSETVCTRTDSGTLSSTTFRSTGERDLVRLAGWSSDAMLSRYGAAGGDVRARQAARWLRRGDRV
jgi:hypothetical protein